MTLYPSLHAARYQVYTCRPAPSRFLVERFTPAASRQPEDLRRRRSSGLRSGPRGCGGPRSPLRPAEDSRATLFTRRVHSLSSAARSYFFQASTAVTDEAWPARTMIVVAPNW